MTNNYKRITSHDAGKISIIFQSILVGILAGGVVVLYRMVLSRAEELSFAIYDYVSMHKISILVLFIGLILAGYAVAYLASRNKMMGGSGIPQIKGILMGYFEQNWVSTLICKFVGGSIAILGGLSLGREGPSIQLGASIAEGVGKKFGKSRMDQKMLIASGASAGLAAAFNAPLAGVIFALEEIFKYFSPLILLSTMSAAVVADFISKNFFGITPIFDFEITSLLSLEDYWIVIVIGVVLGILGALYNYVLLWTQKLYKRLPLSHDYMKMAIPFLISGVLGLTFPVVLGGGHRMVESLQPTTGLWMLIMMFVIKFLFSMVSFGSGAPGGIFFPLLILGAAVGAICSNVATMVFGLDQALFYNILILAMAGYFTAIVRAPITGIVLIMEMTGSLSHMLSLTIVSMTAYIVADLLKSPPIYDALLDNMATEHKIVDDEEHEQKIIMEIIIRHDSIYENCLVKEIKWPEKCLLVSIKRGEKEFIPRGDTRLKVGDYVFALTDLNSEWQVREALETMNGCE